MKYLIVETSMLVHQLINWLQIGHGTFAIIIRPQHVLQRQLCVSQPGAFPHNVQSGFSVRMGPFELEDTCLDC